MSCSVENSTEENTTLEKTEDPLNLDTAIFYHEDDYCQIQILPEENDSALIEQAQKIIGDTFIKKDKLGHESIIVREEENIPLINRKIELQEVEAFFDSMSTQKHWTVATGYGQSHRELSTRTLAYGQEYSAVYTSFTKDSLVENIWLTNPFTLADSGLIDACYKIGSSYQLVLMDWNSLTLVYLSDSIAVSNYLR